MSDFWVGFMIGAANVMFFNVVTIFAFQVGYKAKEKEKDPK